MIQLRRSTFSSCCVPLPPPHPLGSGFTLPHSVSASVSPLFGSALAQHCICFTLSSLKADFYVLSLPQCSHFHPFESNDANVSLLPTAAWSVLNLELFSDCPCLLYSTSFTSLSLFSILSFTQYLQGGSFVPFLFI